MTGGRHATVESAVNSGRLSDYSRPSKTNRADTDNERERSSLNVPLSTRLTEREGVTLRRDVRDWNDLHRDSAVTWREAVQRYRQYIRDKEDVAAIFENHETGQVCEGWTPHRFHPDYSNKQYAKHKDLERGLREDYGKRLHTAMLTLTASGAPDGEPIPPVDHLNELDSSWEAVRRELARRLEGRRWEYLAMLESHGGGGTNHGYLHIHLAVFVDGVVSRRMFAPVIETHLRNCRFAGEDAHDVNDDSTISIRHVGADRSEGTIGNLGTYLAEYLGTYGDDPLDAPDHVQMGNAILWATGKQRWRPTNGAQSYMASEYCDPDEESPWTIIGIRDGEEVRPAPDDGGGVKRFTTGPLGPKGPPGPILS